jgi:hypothetical protein
MMDLASMMLMGVRRAPFRRNVWRRLIFPAVMTAVASMTPMHEDVHQGTRKHQQEGQVGEPCQQMRSMLRDEEIAGYGEER